jgi:hypothetical protein
VPDVQRSPGSTSVCSLLRMHMAGAGRPVREGMDLPACALFPPFWRGVHSCLCLLEDIRGCLCLPPPKKGGGKTARRQWGACQCRFTKSPRSLSAGGGGKGSPKSDGPLPQSQTPGLSRARGSQMPPSRPLQGPFKDPDNNLFKRACPNSPEDVFAQKRAKEIPGVSCSRKAIEADRATNTT